MKVKLFDGEKWQELSGGGGGSSHTHPNLTLLNSITQAMVTAWQSAATWVTTNGANVLAHIADSLRHVPSGGTAGQVLTKTATGTEWATGGGGGGGGNIVQLVDWVSDGTVASKKFDVDVRGYKVLIACAYISPLTATDSNNFLRLKLADVDAWYSGELLFYNKQSAGTYNLYSNGAIVLISNDIAMTRLSWFGSQYNTTGIQPGTMSGFAISENTHLYAEWYNRTVGNIPSGYRVSVFGIK